MGTVQQEDNWEGGSHISNLELVRKIEPKLGIEPQSADPLTDYIHDRNGDDDECGYDNDDDDDVVMMMMM